MTPSVTCDLCINHSLLKPLSHWILNLILLRGKAGNRLPELSFNSDYVVRYDITVATQHHSHHMELKVVVYSIHVTTNLCLIFYWSTLELKDNTKLLLLLKITIATVVPLVILHPHLSLKTNFNPSNAILLLPPLLSSSIFKLQTPSYSAQIIRSYNDSNNVYRPTVVFNARIKERKKQHAQNQLPPSTSIHHAYAENLNFPRSSDAAVLLLPE